MAGEAFQTNLGGWENQPVVQNQVIAYMESIGAPMLLREVYRPLRLPKEIVNRVLGRLHAKGVLTRYKIPVSMHRPDGHGRTAIEGAATRKCFLYAFAEGSGE